MRNILFSGVLFGYYLRNASLFFCSKNAFVNCENSGSILIWSSCGIAEDGSQKTIFRILVTLNGLQWHVYLFVFISVCRNVSYFAVRHVSTFESCFPCRTQLKQEPTIYFPFALFWKNGLCVQGQMYRRHRIAVGSGPN